VIVVLVSLAVIIPVVYLIHNPSTALAAPSITKDPNLKVETVVTGLSSPTSLAFIDNNNILVLEKGGSSTSCVKWGTTKQASPASICCYRK
jgi:aldose sugar dehydrogenase